MKFYESDINTVDMTLYRISRLIIDNLGITIIGGMGLQFADDNSRQAHDEVETAYECLAQCKEAIDALEESSLYCTNDWVQYSIVQYMVKYVIRLTRSAASRINNPTIPGRFELVASIAKEIDTLVKIQG